MPIDVSFDSPLVVSSSSTPNPALDLEFDLSHPAFIVGHQPPGAGTIEWAVNFAGPVRRRPIADITRLVLRHMYGDVVSSRATVPRSRSPRNSDAAGGDAGDGGGGTQQLTSWRMPPTARCSMTWTPRPVTTITSFAV